MPGPPSKQGTIEGRPRPRKDGTVRHPGKVLLVGQRLPIDGLLTVAM
ncbi:hypothetical protein OJF2_73790 [Aquisphaera giovannonii]|uniref:Uncharacterized protein n=1 Tax=Aquisphaera giovannonii TaxID=406548 RepID=A0A5B9WE82_9BACT|nr:hypothetical protein OJF2_73790 [Aquisphaera giovannonii]